MNPLYIIERIAAGLIIIIITILIFYCYKKMKNIKMSGSVINHIVSNPYINNSASAQCINYNKNKIL